MTLVKHELRQGKNALLIWAASIASLLMVCIFLFPEMKDEMDEIGEMFASMGSFAAAFGMGRLNYGTFVGFYSIECGNVLGIGGAFFASLIGVAALSREEKDGTAEFLLTHPVSRSRVVTEKLVGVMVQVVLLNGILLILVVLSMGIIQEEILWKEILLMHLAYFILQIELTGVCFGISAFLRRGSIGVGMGLAILMYFLNLIANMTDRAEFLKYITPFGYCEGADIVAKGSLDMTFVGIGMVLTVLGILAAYVKYTKKDIC